MPTAHASQDDLISPCIKLCAVDGQTGLCLGCGRTLKEIGGWIQLGSDGRAEVMLALPERLERLREMRKIGVTE